MLEPRLCKEKGDADDEAGDCGKRSEGGGGPRGEAWGLISSFISFLMWSSAQCPCTFPIWYYILLISRRLGIGMSMSPISFFVLGRQVA